MAQIVESCDVVMNGNIISGQSFNRLVADPSAAEILSKVSLLETLLQKIRNGDTTTDYTLALSGLLKIRDPKLIQSEGSAYYQMGTYHYIKQHCSAYHRFLLEQLSNYLHITKNQYQIVCGTTNNIEDKALLTHCLAFIEQWATTLRRSGRTSSVCVS